MGTGTCIPISPTGAYLSTVSGINNQGQITGYYETENTSSYFLLDGGMYYLLDQQVVQGLDQAALGLNDAGQIVGESVQPACAPWTCAFFLNPE
jgi:uncharacterized membrane protein